MRGVRVAAAPEAIEVLSVDRVEDWVSSDVHMNDGRPEVCLKKNVKISALTPPLPKGHPTEGDRTLYK